MGPLFLLLCLAGEESPYATFPEAEPPYHRVVYGPGEAGDLAYGVNFTAWVPPGVRRLRGVLVHQHGCGTGSCKSGLTGAYDLHWQALAAKHGMALLSPSYRQPEGASCRAWCDPRQGSAAALDRALVDLGEASGHPEMAEVPLALWGHSGGAFWAGTLVGLRPDRVAAAWLRSGVPPVEPDERRAEVPLVEWPEAALAVPVMCNLGTREGVTDTSNKFAGVWPAVEAFFKATRRRGGLVGVAVDPSTSHECGDQRYLAIPWLDACLTARLPESPGDPLRPMPDGWLAAFPDGPPSSAADFEGDPNAAVWLPSESVAAAWSDYVNDRPIGDDTPPPPPTNVRVEDAVLRWDAAADLQSGVRQFVIERGGEEVARVPPSPTNRFGRPLFQGLLYSDTPVQPLAEMRWDVPDADVGWSVRTVNTAGGVSGPAEVGVVTLFTTPPSEKWTLAGDAKLKKGQPRELIAVEGTGVLVGASRKDRGGRNLRSKEVFGDAEVTLEFMLAKGSNAGVKLQNVYEIQLFDSHGKPDPAATDCGGVYPRAEYRDKKYTRIDEGIPPRLNAAKPAGEWQTLRIVWRSPRFDAAREKTASARLEVVELNGQVIHEDVEVTWPTGANWTNQEKPTGPLYLQGDHGPVAYRNVRVRAQ